MRKLSATYVFTLDRPPLKNGIVSIEDSGEILEIIDTKGRIAEEASMEYYSGFLVPGFVNAHCHLQLSHLKGMIEQHTGIAGFISKVAMLKKFPEETIINAARQADHFLYKSGTIAVADIVNSSAEMEVKENSKLYYHTFFECIGLRPHDADRMMEYGAFVKSLYKTSKLECGISPHAPYTVGPELMNRLAQNAQSTGELLSLHHQESGEEQQMFRSGDGPIVEFLSEKLKLPLPFDKAPDISSTLFSVPQLPKENPLLLVHNTMMDQQNFDELKSIRSVENTWLVTCPNSNLYIENRLPDYELWIESGFPVCIGTDSLSSNTSLSVLEEMKTIQLRCNIPVEELFLWACRNGAKALSIDSWAGTLAKGKKPGINLIENVNLKAMKLQENSKVVKLA
jgi:aminodeoxyfutalosine deaminase